jgi:arylsulfatase A-like enzyme
VSIIKGEKITRRDFIKLLSLAPYFAVNGINVPNNKKSYILDRNDDLPNVIVLVFDTLSARHMSLYGYQRRTTPNIDRLANQATVYHRNYAGGNFTSPGTASLLTGSYPWSHRSLHLYGTVLEEYATKNIFSLTNTKYFSFTYTHNILVTLLLNQFFGSIDQFIPTGNLSVNSNLNAENLFSNDYPIALWSELLYRSFQEISTTLFYSLIDSKWRHDKPNEISDYERLFPKGLPTDDSRSIIFTLEHTIDWLKTNLTSMPSPFFCYFHLLPPHEPYHTRSEFVDVFNDGITQQQKPNHNFSQGQSNQFLIDQRRFYDEYIAYVDSEFGRFVDFLNLSGLLENTYLILTSDHGQMFERGIHGHITETLYEPIIHVPLVILRPKQKYREDVHVPTSCVDLVPTILHIADCEIPEWCEGNILPPFKNTEVDSSRNVFSVEAKSNSKWGPLSKGTIALIRDNFKLIHYYGYSGYGDEFELFDLLDDPDELDNKYLSHKSLADEMRSQLLKKINQINATNSRKISDILRM